MASQIYLNNSYKIVEIPTTELTEYSISKEFYLGDSEKYSILYDPLNSFNSLGGSKSNPLIYTFENTGITEFNLNFYMEDSQYSKATPLAWELWIYGDKTYYYNFLNMRNNIFNRNLSVKGTKGKNTKFKVRVTAYDFYIQVPLIYKYYFYGENDMIYSNITAKFIPDAIEEKNFITITNDCIINMNNRYVVNSKKNELITLKIKEEDCKLGSWFEVKNLGYGEFRIVTGDKIQFVMYNKKTKEKNGYLKSKDIGDFIRLECMQISPKIIFSDTVRIGNYIMV